MLGGAGTEKILLLNIVNEACVKKLFFNSSSFFILGGVGTKMFNSKNILDGNGIEIAPLTQYVRGDWRKKPLFTGNARRRWYKKTL